MIPIFLVIALVQNHLVQSNKAIASSYSRSTLKARNAQLAEDFKIPSPSEVYDILIGMQSVYPEGKYWTDASSGLYTWKGGTGNNREIANMGTGCVYFCFHLSDTAFGTLPARLTRTGGFTISDVRVGDLLRTDFNTHSVIVLQVHDQSVVVAEGNYKKSIHWGRVLSKSEVENADHLITRYPEGYVPPEDPNANKEVAGGSFGTNDQLKWSLNGAGYLKISGNGNCPDYDSFSDTPWSSHIDKVTSVIFESGVTSIGSNSFYGTNIYGLTIASTVKTIGDNAFRNCAKLSTVSIPEGTEIVGINCFRGCKSLQTVTFPSTIKEVKDSALMSNEAMTTVKFTPGDIKVTIGNSLFCQCYALKDLTLPTLMDKISDDMFFSSKMYYLYIPNGVESIGNKAFQQSTITTLVIPNTVTSIGMTALSYNLQSIYFCGTEAQWNSINKGGNDQFLNGKPIYYVADVSSVKILNNQNADVQGTTVQMGVGEFNIYKLELTYTEGQKLIDPRDVELFCVASNTPTNNIKSIESAASAGDIVGLKIITKQVDNEYSVSLNVSAIQNGNARIIGHVKKNPTSSMASNTDHIYSYVDINVQGSNPPNVPPSSNPNVPQPPNPDVPQPPNPDVPPSSNPDVPQPPNPDVPQPPNPDVPQETTSDLSHLVPEETTQMTNNIDNNQNSKGKGKKGLSGGAIAGIVIAVVVVAAGAGVGIFLFLRNRKSKVAQGNSSDSV